MPDKTIRPPKAKQGHLEGLEPPSIPEIDDAAEAYYDLNDESWKMRGKVAKLKRSKLRIVERLRKRLIAKQKAQEPRA